MALSLVAAICTTTGAGVALARPAGASVATGGPIVTCASDPAIFNTGYDAQTGGVLPDYSTDANWQVTGPVDGVTDSAPPPVDSIWGPTFVGAAAPTAYAKSPYGNAQWISQQTINQTQPGDNGDWYYKYDFNLDPSVDPSTFSLTMNFLADNEVQEVYVNGVAQSPLTTGLPQDQIDSFPYEYYGFRAVNAAATTLDHSWQTGANEIVVQMKSSAPYEGFDAQLRPSALCPVDLSVTKTASPDPYVAGQTLSYTIAINNNGPGNAAAVHVYDPLPTALASAAFTWTCSATAGSSCSSSGTGGIGDFVAIEAGGTVTYTLTGTVPSGASGDISNTVTVTPAQGTQDANCTPNCSATATTPQSAVPVTVSGSQTYGSDSPSFPFTAEGVTPSGTATCTQVLVGDTPTDITASLPAGTYPIDGASCSGLSGSTFDYQGGSFVVAPAPLTITASSPTMTYGGSAPSVTPSYSGFVNGDTADSLSSGPTCTATDTSNDVGSYAGATSCSGASDPNYDISYDTGSLTITAAPLTVTVSGGETYGGTPIYSVSESPDVALSGNVSCGDVVVGDGTAAVSSPVTPNVGTYTLASSSCSGLSASSNYNLEYVGAADGFDVDPATLNITASPATMTYGGSAPSVTPSYSGFVNGDTAESLSSAPTCAAADTTNGVGTYSEATSCSGASDANYQFNYSDGSLTIGPAQLTIAASSATMTYGGAEPSVTPRFSGFVNGDTPRSLTPGATCRAVGVSKSSGVGRYETSCSGAGDKNYRIEYTDGSLSIVPARLTVTADSTFMLAGGPVPEIVPEYAGFVDQQTPSSLTVQPHCRTTATSQSRAGRYPTSCAGAVDRNYSIAYLAGILTVGENPGYRLEGGDGGVFDFHKSFVGSVPPPSLGLHIFDFVAMATTKTGYWLAERDGGVFAFGTAPFLGSLPSEKITVDNIVGIAATPDGKGYWMVSSNGHVYTFGDAVAHGDATATGINDIVGIASPDAGGYWLLSSDGRVLPYGDARHLGDCGGAHSGCQGLEDIVSMTVRNGGGYWLVGRDGGVFGFGDAHYFGSCPQASSHCHGVNDVVGIASPDPNGYWLAEADGNVLAFGDAKSFGRCGDAGSNCVPLVRPIVAIAS
jgi:uncharacterized repeat protein (TIGR01451 family)